MANQEHLERLKQGVASWNQWREEHPEIRPDLTRTDLSGADLGDANLFGTDLFGTDLRYADLNGADLIASGLCEANLGEADLDGANLDGANLSGANLSGANLNLASLDGANLSEADLSEADLSNAYFFGADLSGADLSNADLTETALDSANLREANLSGANFHQASVGWTYFGDVDLSEVRGLETVEHEGPSSIGIDTIYRSQGKIPNNFLRKAGVPEDFIIYMRSLVNTPIDYYTCFISYSSKDQHFAERLYDDLQNKGVRCWFAPKDLKIGDHYHQRIDESIRLYDKLILILSEHAVQSAWVEREMVAAREKEEREQRLVLFPIRLDDEVMDTTKAWAADVRRRWHIGDFTQWKDNDAYQQAFERLLRDLKAGAKP